MHYKNGGLILPPDLLNQVQEYIQGEVIYVPKKGLERAGWGQKNGARTALRERNREIRASFRQGRPVPELVALYCLSEDSIRKILRDGAGD